MTANMEEVVVSGSGNRAGDAICESALEENLGETATQGGVAALLIAEVGSAAVLRGAAGGRIPAAGDAEAA